MAVTFPITGVAAAYASGTSFTVTLGTAPATDDIVLVAIGATSTGGVVTVPGDWVNVTMPTYTVMSTSAHFGLMIYHRVTSAEAGANTLAWTFTNIFSTAKTGSYAATVLRGVATSSELIGVGSWVQPAAFTYSIFPDVGVTLNNMPVVSGMCLDSTGTITTPDGWTNLCTVATTQRSALYLRDALASVGESTEIVVTTASDESISISVAFRDASPSAILVPVTVDVKGTLTVSLSAENPVVGAASAPPTFTMTPTTGIAALGKVTLAWTAPTSEVAS